MALTSAQQNKVCQLLGYPGEILNQTSVVYDKIFGDRLSNLLADTEAGVVSLLGMVTALEAQINAAPARLAAEKVADITMNLHELEGLRRERKRVAREIAALLNLPYRGVNGSNVSVRC